MLLAYLTAQHDRSCLVAESYFPLIDIACSELKYLKKNCIGRLRVPDKGYAVQLDKCAQFHHWKRLRHFISILAPLYSIQP